MPWRLNKNGVVPAVALTVAEQNNLNTFMGNIQRMGMHPAEAARGFESFYKQLVGDQYQIRLSIHNRATFTVNTTTQVVTMLQVGGHA